MAQTREGAMKVAAQRVGIDIEEYKARVAGGQKWCFQCRSWRVLDDFGQDSTRFDGRAARCLHCVRVKERKSTKGRPSPFKGRTHTPEAKAQMSAVRRGRPNPRKGVPRTSEERARISQRVRETTPRGAACQSWKGGVTPRNKADRKGTRYADWRKAVFERDSYTCQHCGDNSGGNLNAHHLKDFANHLELRFDVANGLTLCEPCHEAVHTAVPRIRRQTL